MKNNSGTSYELYSMVCHFSFLQEFEEREIGFFKEIETHDYLFQSSNFLHFLFFILIKKYYLCGVILENVDL